MYGVGMDLGGGGFWRWPEVGCAAGRYAQSRAVASENSENSFKARLDKPACRNDPRAGGRRGGMVRINSLYVVHCTMPYLRSLILIDAETKPRRTRRRRSRGRLLLLDGLCPGGVDGTLRRLASSARLFALLEEDGSPFLPETKSAGRKKTSSRRGCGDVSS